MTERVLTDTSTRKELIPLFIGHEKCTKGHAFGPYVRNYYLIHFCLGGRGILKNSRGEFLVRKGQLFVIRPDEVTTYTADAKDPWEYLWIAFRGFSAKVFDDERSVYDTPEDLDEKLYDYLLSETHSPEIYLSILYELIFHLFSTSQKSESQDKIRQVKRYVKYNYMLTLTVEGLARDFGFERSYLYRLFKKRYGVGIKEYIISTRMEMAYKFLREGYRVSETAHLVGYTDEFNFSKVFKNYYGIPPSTARLSVDSSLI